MSKVKTGVGSRNVFKDLGEGATRRNRGSRFTTRRWVIAPSWHHPRGWPGRA